jgi:hypothetical protein
MTSNAQLHLIHFDDDQWKLDARTIRVGRKGLAEARAALARANRSARADRNGSDEKDGATAPAAA